MSYAQYYRELFRLLRGLPQNPVFRATAPWRRASGMRVWFWMNVALSVAVVVATPLIAIKTSVEPWSRFNAAAIAGALTLAVVTFLPIGGFLASWGSWSSAECLEELYLTQLSPREIALALVAWPAMGALWLPLALSSAAFVLTMVDHDGSRTLRLGIAMHGFSTSLYWLGAVVLALVFAQARLGRRRWPLFVVAPVLAGLCVWVLQLVIEFVDELAPRRSSFLSGVPSGRETLGIVLACFVVLPVLAREAGRFAGSALYDRIEVVEHQRRDPIRTNPVAWLSAWGVGSWGDFRQDVAHVRVLRPSTTWGLLGGLVLAAIVAGAIESARRPAGDAFWYGFGRVCCMWSLAALMLTQMVVAEFAMLRRGRPIVAWSMLRSLVHPHLGVLFRHIVVWWALGLLDFIWRRTADWEEIILDVIFPGVLFPLCITFMTLPLTIGVVADGACRPTHSALPAAIVLIALLYVLVAIGPMTVAPYRESGPFWEFWAWRTLEPIACFIGWLACLALGRLTDIYTRLGLGFAEPGTVLYLRRGERTGA